MFEAAANLLDAARSDCFFKALIICISANLWSEMPLRLIKRRTPLPRRLLSWSLAIADSSVVGDDASNDSDAVVFVVDDDDDAGLSENRAPAMRVDAFGWIRNVGVS